MEEASSNQTHTVIFQPSGARGKVPTGTTVRSAARQLGVEIESICAENVTCGKCRVSIQEGFFERMGVRSSKDHLSSIGDGEGAYLQKRRDIWVRSGVDVDNLRLSCQARVEGDVLVFVPEASRANRQIVRKSISKRAIQVKPVVRRYYLEMDLPTLENPSGDWERLSEGLVAAMHKVAGPGESIPASEDLKTDLSLLQVLPTVLREADWKVTVAVRSNRDVVDVRSGYHEQTYGAAVDIGTTTIALYLCDLATGEVVASETMMNPQVAFGEDVLSRITFALGGEDELRELNAAVVEAINTLLKRARRTQSLAPDDVLEMVVVGNTCMHHLFLNIEPRYLGLAPYTPAVQQALDVRAIDLGVNAHPGARVHLLPVQASFVGADNSAVLIAEEPHEQDQQWLIIDVGTNAELVLGNRERLLGTSTPTGPAFEGAHVEYGMRAAPGAIERIDIDAETLEPQYQVIGAGESSGRETEVLVKGICGSAIIDAVAEMFRVGILDTHGRFASDLDSPRLRKGEFGPEYVLAWEQETSIGRDIPITLGDVRQIQLAKAALYTASRLLLRTMGIQRPDKILLAGGFGTYIDKTKAMLLGMIPDCPLEDVYAVGNSAGDGAVIALLNRDKRAEAAEVVKRIERVELPVDPDFQNQYMLALNFPHMCDPFPHVIDLVPHYEPDPRAYRFQTPRGS